MRGKVAKILRNAARHAARSLSDPVEGRKHNVRYPAGSFRRIYRDMKRNYRRLGRAIE